VTALTSAGPGRERLPWLSLLPTTLTGLYYLLPPSLQGHVFVIFLPQMTAYVALLAWLSQNSDALDRLGLTPERLGQGVRWGLPIGLALGIVNVSVILFVVPGIGGDVLFLRDTPHARMPPEVMFPWTIVTIAILIELNFRGFLLGRLLALWQSFPLHRYHRLRQGLAIVASSVVFAFDPFMVTTFKHLHWIAVWDGLIWGWLWIRLQNLYAPIVAHAVEVMILYAVLKAVLAT
jgi:membrane protease YdiL (CAAX protease family)